MQTRDLRRSLGAAVALCAVAATIASQHPPLYKSGDPGTTADVKSWLRALKQPVLTDDMTLVILAEQELLVQPFEATQMARDGSWDQTGWLDALEEHRFGAILLTRGEWARWQSGRSTRFSKQAIAAALRAYPVSQEMGLYRVLIPPL